MRAEGVCGGDQRGSKLLGFNWTAKVSAAGVSVTETEQIIVSHCCSWPDELLTLEVESCASLCFVWRGGDVLPTPRATEVSVQDLQVFPRKLYPSLVDLPLAMEWSRCLFSFYPFWLISTIVPCPSHSPQKCLDGFCYFEECYSEILHMVSFIV